MAITENERNSAKESSSRRQVIQPVCGKISRIGENIMIPENRAIFTIGTAAKMLEVHPRTLRIYERENLVKPLRKGQWRYYTMDDIKWIQCLRDMIHDHGISIAAIKKLLLYTPCWNIAECPLEKRKQCTAFMASGLVPRKLDLDQRAGNVAA